MNDSDPDYTFNHYGFPAIINKLFPNAEPDKGVLFAINWDKNAARTLDAERKLYETLKSSPWAKEAKVSFDDLAITLIAFNTTGESEEYTFTWDPETGKQTRTANEKVEHSDIVTIGKAFAGKLAVLNKALADLGYADIDLTDKKWAYVVDDAASNRQKYLGDLQCADYPGVILPKGICAMP